MPCYDAYMTAPKRTRAGITNVRNPPSSPIERLSNDPRFQAGLQAILEKFKAPYDEEENRQVLALVLTVQAGLVVVPPRRYQPDRSKGTGKAWEALGDFPARFRALADEVERLSQGLWFNPQSWVMNDRAKEADFVGLPTVMRSFASHVEERAKQVRQYSGLSYKGKCSPEIGPLMERVKQYAGQYRDQEVCELLNAAANVMGSKTQFDLQTLMDCRQRSKRRQRHMLQRTKQYGRQ